MKKVRPTKWERDALIKERYYKYLGWSLRPRTAINILYNSATNKKQWKLLKQSFNNIIYPEGSFYDSH